MRAYEASDDEFCLIALSGVEGLGLGSVSRLCKAARERGVPLAAVVGLPAAELEAEAGLTAAGARAASALADPVLMGRSLLRRAGASGGRVLLAGREDYPLRLRTALGAQAPPVLFVHGEPSILRRPCAAVVGSRRPSRAASEGTQFLAGDLAARGVTVVSGGARGTDTLAHCASVTNGATAVVPAMGLERFRWRDLGRSAPPPHRWCGVGQFPPRSGWRTAYALMRNRTIVALSDVVVAFEPRDSGGTWRTCLHALRLCKPLFVVSNSRQGAKGRGLRRLVRMGAVALDPRCMPSGRAFDRLVAEYRPPPGVEQEALFGGDEADR